MMAQQLQQAMVAEWGSWGVVAALSIVGSGEKKRQL